MIAFLEYVIVAGIIKWVLIPLALLFKLALSRKTRHPR